jgi:PadR family transcriptional regulator PadR
LEFYVKGDESMKVDKELQKGSTVTLILSLLNERPMYGYEMIREIEHHSGGIFAFKEGTLYPILHSLEANRHVESFWEATNGGRRRKYYSITSSGRSRLQEKRQEWALFKAAVDRVIGEARI